MVEISNHDQEGNIPFKDTKIGQTFKPFEGVSFRYPGDEEKMRFELNGTRAILTVIVPGSSHTKGRIQLDVDVQSMSQLRMLKKYAILINISGSLFALDCYGSFTNKYKVEEVIKTKGKAEIWDLRNVPYVKGRHAEEFNKIEAVVVEKGKYFSRKTSLLLQDVKSFPRT